MKNQLFHIICLFILVLISACSKDEVKIDTAEEVAEETIDDTSSQPTLSELRSESTTILTSGNSKTWRINQATLTNGNSTIDISSNFNVVDDEFIFGGSGENGTLEWRKGFDIKTNATNNSETLLDKYVSAISTTFQYTDESSSTVVADFGTCIFDINTNNTLTATITNEDSSVFIFVLVVKTQNDYLSPSQSGLNFTSAFAFESNSIRSMAPGMIGSYSNNSIYIVTREDGLRNIDGESPERIIKFNIETNSISENLFFQHDFASKQLHIIDNKLIIVGGQYVNQYDLSLSNDPVSASHGKSLSRFGISVLDDDAYIIGGDLREVEDDKIFKWDINSETLSEFTTLPEEKNGARGTIVNDNLYVFGGSETLLGFGTPTNTIYKVSTNNPSQIETFQMNKAINFTFVQKYQNLIYVAGRIEVVDNTGATTGREATIGVFNTIDNTYQELVTNLTNFSGFDTIHQMCILNGKMYVIYGNEGVNKGGQFPGWDVLVSDLN